MQVYLVGGAVRDKVLNRTCHDADYVVVGASIQDMLDNDFVQVGADFPVFLHPHSKQEYALARTERKSGVGYKGFEVHASADVTLEEDLIRRDLTINAMAIEVNGLFDDTEKSGDVIDPYQGLDDIKNKKLRHVSKAFLEDPLRVLRVARFYSRLYTEGFGIAEETLTVMKKMVANKQLDNLSRERIWTESERAIKQTRPDIYWQILYEINALGLFAPLETVWQDVKIRTRSLSALQKSAQLKLTVEQRWAVLLSGFCLGNSSSDLNLTVVSSTTAADAPLKIIDAHNLLNQHNTIPKRISQFALKLGSYYHQLLTIEQLDADTLMQLLQNLNAHKEPRFITELLAVVAVIEQYAVETYDPTNAILLLQTAYDCHHAVTIKDIDASLRGKAIGDALTVKRVATLNEKIKKVIVKIT